MEQEQKWVDPTPASLFLVFIVAMPLWQFLTGGLSLNAAPLIGVGFLTAGIFWFMASVINFRMGDVLGGCINGVFAIGLGFLPGANFLVQAFGPAMGVTLDPRADGWFFLCIGIVFMPFALGVAKRLWHLAIGLFVLGCAFIINGLALAGLIGIGMLPVGGWFIFVGAIILLYNATAMVLAGAFGKPVLPLGGPLIR